MTQSAPSGSNGLPSNNISASARHSVKKPDENVNYNPQSVLGEVSVKEMGSRVDGFKPQNSDANGFEPNSEDEVAKSGSNAAFFPRLYGEDTTYRPTTVENQERFELLITHIHSLLPDEPQNVVISAADSVLEIVMDVELSVKQKQKAVEELLSMRLDELQMAEFFKMCKQISDYGKQAAEENLGEEPLAVDFEEEDLGAGETKPVLEDSSEFAVDEKEPLSLSIGPSSEPTIITANQDEETALILINNVSKDTLFSRVSVLEPEMESEHVREMCKSISRVIAQHELESTEYEKKLMEILDFKHLEFVRFCVQNRTTLHYGLRLLANRKKTIADIKEAGLSSLLVDLGLEKPKKRRNDDDEDEDEEEPEQDGKKRSKTGAKLTREPRIIDLDGLVFDQGAHLMTQDKTVLPKGSFQENKKLYDIITVPAPAPPPSLEDSGEKLVSISEMPEWAQAAFPSAETSSLNRVQSKIYPTAFLSDENLLLCAPTGAGKTNVAMLTVLRMLHNYRDSDTGQIRVKDFKAVYVAPLKALVSEQMREFERRLSAQYGVKVNELTGDLSLSQREIAESQILVTTPEKWDVITRKLVDLPNVKAVKLLIIDEIHLLHDDRGPVLESIIMRAKRQQGLRLVGLSATLPNFEDVARFLQVDLKKGLFYFGPQFRPCPLEQQYMGVKEKKPIKKIAAMNEACYEKVVNCQEQGHQVIIFVHSRKDTVKTAQWLRDRMAESDKSALRSLTGTQELLRQEGENAHNKNLSEILPLGFGIHHAGLDKSDRSVVEDLFAQGHIQILVSTATLAWGVNLPAHTVIIKGTDTYNPEKGMWVQLSPQDILQMLGRAGRPRYDKSGEGVIITANEELQYYLAVLNQQLPIESQFMSKLANNLNAEVVLGTITCREDAVEWLAQTYLYIRMLKAPKLYQVGSDYDTTEDPTLYWKRVDLAHSALAILQEHHLVTYEASLGFVATTELGKISAHFYINYESASMYNTRLKPWMLEIDIFQVFSYSGEFKYVPVRQEEKLEIRKLAEKCPIPIKEKPNDPHAKINVLLQLYITKLRLDGFALTADMIYVTQSAGRLMRAIHEICLKKKWSQLAETTLAICKYVESRMWSTSSAFRQYGTLAPLELVKATEASHLPFMSYFQLSPAELSEAISFRGSSQLAHDLLKQYPKFNIEGHAQPVTSDMIRCLVEIMPEWEWNWKLHGSSELFLVIVADCDGERVLFDDVVKITKRHLYKSLSLDFTVSSVGDIKTLGPSLYVSVSSEKWIHSTWKAPVKLFHLEGPKEPKPLTKVLDVQSVPVASLGDPTFEALFPFSYFNKFQSQCFHSLWNTNDSLFIGANKGCGKTTAAELAIINSWRQNKQRILYLQPSQERIDILLKKWTSMFSSLTDPPKVVAKLAGDLAADVRTLSLSHLVLATPAQFDVVSRKWRSRKLIQSLELVIADDAHLVGSPSCGVSYEAVLTRIKFMATHLGRDIRVLALSFPLVYGREFAGWLGCTKKLIYNFGPNYRAKPISEIRLLPCESNVTIASLGNKQFVSLLESTKSLLVFVSSKKAALDLAPSILNFEALFPKSDSEEMNTLLERLDDKSLIPLLNRSVGLFHESMLRKDKTIVERLFTNNFIKVLIATKDTCTYAPYAHSVLIYGTQTESSHQANDYYLTDLMEMVGCCDGGRVLVYALALKVEYYSHFLTHPLPVESLLHNSLQDAFIHEISTRTIKTKQDCVDWITYTFFYCRLNQNPSFYGLKLQDESSLSEYLSELVEATLEDLEQASLIEIIEPEDEDDEDEEEAISPLNGSMIASHYNVQFASMKQIRNLSASSRLRNILEAITSASEFEDLPIRAGEEQALQKISQHVPLKLSGDTDFESPHVKAFLLLQAHFSRVKLSGDLAHDQKHILATVLKLVNACVDSLSSEGLLNALQAMDLSQMIVQGMWSNQSPLYQIPHVTPDLIERCKKYDAETVFDIMALEDDERDDVLRMEGEPLEDVANFVNKYPNIDVSYELDMLTPMVANEGKEVIVTIERDEEMEDLEVETLRFPIAKAESWWVVVGDSATRQLYGIKKLLVKNISQEVKIEVSVPNSGKHQLTIWCMCDSYVDADKEMLFEVDVQLE
ncbi:hypothetical protein PUMCH_001397 [Australozyma saopauloensis]|uniref:U5 small nuclear ribonucleoprotein 200 kDa helicase n=1 Tax=Australozyma saopauloensis TaxID=291208 RepID=A0AAX4H6B1_9ASCO|nr:hypothetical protein PUMCH_001397 [[Candida] saopauloensis]